DDRCEVSRWHYLQVILASVSLSRFRHFRVKARVAIYNPRTANHNGHNRQSTEDAAGRSLQTKATENGRRGDGDCCGKERACPAAGTSGRRLLLREGTRSH